MHGGNVSPSVTNEEVNYTSFYLNGVEPRPRSLRALPREGVLPGLLMISPFKTSYSVLQDTPRVKT